MPRRRCVGIVAAFGELAACVLANRVEHEIACAVVAFLERHERLVDQGAEQVEHVEARQRLAAADRFRRGEIEAVDEDAEPVEHDLLVLLEQLVRPVDQRAQRLLPLLVDARSSGEKLVAVLEAGVDVGDGQRAHARRGELERERNALEPRDQLGDRRRLLLGQREVVSRCREVGGGPEAPRACAQQY